MPLSWRGSAGFKRRRAIGPAPGRLGAMNWRRFGSCMLGVALALALGACGSLPAGVERTVSTSLPAAPEQSPLARLAETTLPAGAQSGFRLLPLGAYGLDARL